VLFGFGVFEKVGWIEKNDGWGQDLSRLSWAVENIPTRNFFMGYWSGAGLYGISTVDIVSWYAFVCMHVYMRMFISI